MADGMDILAMPQHPGLIEALGRLAIAHTHLELILRYTVKTVGGLSITEALDATRGERISDVRGRVRKLFLQIKPLPSEVAKLDALPGAAQRWVRSVKSVTQPIDAIATVVQKTANVECPAICAHGRDGWGMYIAMKAKPSMRDESCPR